MSLNPYIKKAKINFNNEGDQELLATIGLPWTRYSLAPGILKYTVKDQDDNEEQRQISFNRYLESGQEKDISIPVEETWKSVEFICFENCAGTMPLNGLAVKGKYKTLFI